MGPHHQEGGVKLRIDVRPIILVNLFLLCAPFFLEPVRGYAFFRHFVHVGSTDLNFSDLATKADNGSMD